MAETALQCLDSRLTSELSLLARRFLSGWPRLVSFSDSGDLLPRCRASGLFSSGLPGSISPAGGRLVGVLVARSSAPESGIKKEKDDVSSLQGMICITITISCMYVLMYVCMYACISIYIYIYIYINI